MSASSPTGTRGRSWPRLGLAPGSIVAEDGTPLGTHDGTYGFTIGQRKGLRVGAAGDGRPRYVLDIQPASRTVTVGPRESLDVLGIVAQRPVWTGCAPPGEPRTCWPSWRLMARPIPPPHAWTVTCS